MSQLLAAGGRRLSGEVTIQGAKNSVLPILAATLLTADTVVLRRCPRLKDVEASIRILEALGCTARWQNDALVVDTAGMNGCAIPDALMREMRSSVIFLGAILARCGQAAVSWDPGPLTCTSPACGRWARKSLTRAVRCAVRRKH